MKRPAFDLIFWLACSAELIILACYGIAYNRFVARLESERHDRGYMGFIVAAGCAITITGAAIVVATMAGPLVGLLTWLITLTSFIASGTPMILGSVTRYIQRRQEDEQAALNQMKELPAWFQQLRTGPGGETNGQTETGRLQIQTGTQPRHTGQQSRPQSPRENPGDPRPAHTGTDSGQDHPGLE